jgi:DNA-directed RNA polymerase subunit M/transcription elongation factor TFIIS
MMLLKGCPRCRGDLHINKDTYGDYKQCVQCGYLEDMDPSAVPVAAAKKAA